MLKKGDLLAVMKGPARQAEKRVRVGKDATSPSQCLPPAVYSISVSSSWTKETYGEHQDDPGAKSGSRSLYSLAESEHPDLCFAQCQGCHSHWGPVQTSPTRQKGAGPNPLRKYRKTGCKKQPEDKRIGRGKIHKSLCRSQDHLVPTQTGLK